MLTYWYNYETVQYNTWLV